LSREQRDELMEIAERVGDGENIMPPMVSLESEASAVSKDDTRRCRCLVM